MTQIFLPRSPRWGRALLIVLAFGLSCSSDTPRVVLLGDSITAGMVGGPDGAPFHQLLEQSLGDRIEFRNIACGGVSTAHWLVDADPIACQGVMPRTNLFLARLAPNMPAELVIVLLGTNDSLAIRGRVEANDYEQQLRQLVSSLIERGAKHVLLLAPPFINTKIKASVLLQAYGKRVREICAAQQEVTCGPDLFSLLRASDFAMGDPHPRVSGHAKIADAIEVDLRAIFDLDEPASEPDSGGN